MERKAWVLRKITGQKLLVILFCSDGVTVALDVPIAVQSIDGVTVALDVPIAV
jgi:sulfur transfer complex TusBCD TusB component (DsrH family)